MAALLAFFRSIGSFLGNLPKLIQLGLLIADGVKWIWQKMKQRRQDEIVKDGQDAVDHTTQTGDQRREEDALSGSKGGAPARDRRGVRTRPTTEDEE